MRSLVTFIFSILFLTSLAQVKSYHKYSPTASDNVITKWNLSKDSLKFIKWYVEETTDKKGRVIELKFMKDGMVNANSLCYLPDIVKYTYPDNYTIIESFFNYDNTPEMSLECEQPYKIIYTLNNKFQIIKAVVKFYLNEVEMLKNGFSKNAIKTEFDFLKKQMSDSAFNESNSHFVSYYLKSYSKLNRIFPINKKLSSNDLFDDDTNVEYWDAKKCIKSN